MNSPENVNVAAASFHDLGLAYRAEGNNREAEDNYRQAILLQPDYAEAHYNLAVLLQESERSSEARRHYEQAITAKPTYVQALNNLGTVLDEEGDHRSAEASYVKALDVNPNVPEVLSSLGSCLRSQGRYSEAAEKFKKAISIRPIFPAAQWNLGFLELALGQFEEGWANYRYRHSADRKINKFPDEILPEDLNGRRIRLGREQGLGDELFFLRFCHILRNRGAQLSYQASPAIESLCQRMDSIDFIPADEAEEAYSIADLPFLLRCSTPQPSVKIKPLEDRVNKMTALLTEAGPAPHIGLTYRAGIAESGSLFKETSIEGIGNAIAGAKGTIINLQRGPQAQEAESLVEYIGRELADFTQYNDDLEDMIALVSLLDDYIGVSNTNMHLRAAVGKPARVLVTHPGEYRWMAEGAQSPWFPDFTLYRQSVDDSWQEAIDRLGADLRASYG